MPCRSGSSANIHASRLGSAASCRANIRVEVMRITGVPERGEAVSAAATPAPKAAAGDTENAGTDGEGNG